mgnify:CR=1 FL=1
MRKDNETKHLEGLRDYELEYLLFLRSKQNRKHHWVDEIGQDYF